MSAYRKFSELWQNELRAPAPPKPAKAPKVDPIEAGTFGGLGALGEAEPQNRNSASPGSLLDSALTMWSAAEEERAAIVEYDGNIPRAWAEGFARLNSHLPPAGVSVRRWQAIIDAIGAFLDHWAAKAAAQGWEAADIFGADAIRPEISWLNSGPLWAGNGARVVEVHPDHRVFETRSGAKQTHYRRPHLRPRALPWEIGCR
jgi:hypothetical protein